MNEATERNEFDRELPLGGLGMSETMKSRLRKRWAADAAAAVAHRRAPGRKNFWQRQREADAAAITGQVTRDARRCPCCGQSFYRTHCPLALCAQENGGRPPETLVMTRAVRRVGGRETADELAARSNLNEGAQ